MQVLKKIILGLIRSISRLFGGEDFVEKKMESVWRFMHRKEVIENLEEVIENLEADVESLKNNIESMNREKEKLIETIQRIRGEYEGKTDYFLDRERILPGIFSIPCRNPAASISPRRWPTASTSNTGKSRSRMGFSPITS